MSLLFFLRRRIPVKALREDDGIALLYEDDGATILLED